MASVPDFLWRMIRVGDWIEMPQLNADGDVIDIALHTVKIQNWDKTITTIQPNALSVTHLKTGVACKKVAAVVLNAAYLLTRLVFTFIQRRA